VTDNQVFRAKGNMAKRESCPRYQRTVDDGQSRLVEPGDAMVFEKPNCEHCERQQEHED